MVAINVAEKLARNCKVFVLPWWSEKPTLSKDILTINNVIYLRRTVSLKFIIYVLKSLNKIPSISMKYAFGLGKLKYSIIYLFDRALIELLLDELNIDVIHIHGFSLAYLPYIDVAIENDIPLVCTSHGLVFNNLDYIDYDHMFERYVLEQVSMAKHAAITAVSSTLKNKILTLYNISTTNVAVILNGIDVTYFKCHLEFDKIIVRKRFKIPIEKTVILQVGSVTKRKNHIEVLKAITAMDKETREQIVYLIIGMGDETGNLVKFCNDYNITNCLIMGWTNQSDLVQLYLSSDFLILPSTSEGFPLVFLEAMAAGLPIITYQDLEGVSDLYNEYNMELIHKRDVESMAISIRQAVRKSWDKEKIVEYSRTFSWDNVANEYLKLYVDVINSTHRR